MWWACLWESWGEWPSLEVGETLGGRGPQTALLLGRRKLLCTGSPLLRLLMTMSVWIHVFVHERERERKRERERERERVREREREWERERERNTHQWCCKNEKVWAKDTCKATTSRSSCSLTITLLMGSRHTPFPLRYGQNARLSCYEQKHPLGLWLRWIPVSNLLHSWSHNRKWGMQRLWN